jgi:uncharacterized protein
MPPLIPGTYVEDTAGRLTPIQPVPTAGTGFIGHVGQIPSDDDPVKLVASLAEFAEHYGAAATLTIAGTQSPNMLAHAVHGFFANGGTQLWVSPIAAAESLAVSSFETALARLDVVEDIGLIAAPGAALLDQAVLAAINSLLIANAKARMRFAVLDTPAGLDVQQLLDFRVGYDSSYAALYCPWLQIPNPLDPAQSQILVPPSGLVAGAIARTDRERGVFKAPANEGLVNVSGLERPITEAEQQILNPDGINCIRFFDGRGIRIWGARTLSSDPEWKYINVRRYFLYLEQSIDKGTQWAVFEPNGERLWANVKRTIEDFLLNEWQNGALLGDRPEKAYFVRCDRTTMAQSDLDNGRLICQIGVAPLKPAEFVIFRIGQWTADKKV